MQDLSFLQQLHPVTPMPSPIDRMAKLLSLQNAAIQGQDLQAQVQERKAAASKTQEASDVGKRIQDVIVQHYQSGGSPDDPELFKKISAISLEHGDAYTKSREAVLTAAATRKNLESEATNRETPAERAARLVPESVRAYQAWLKTNNLPDNAGSALQYKLQGMKVTPNESVLGGDGKPLYTAPPAPRVPVPGVDVPLPAAVATQKEQITAAGKTPPQPQVAYIDDPQHPGQQIAVTVDKAGGTAAPITLNGKVATKKTAQEQNRAEQATIVSNYADRIIRMIDKNPTAVGPILGRIAKGETAIGTVSPEAKALGTALGSFVALQPILHGFRGGGQTVEHFVGVLGDQHLNAAALKASLMEIKALAGQIKGDSETPAIGGWTVKVVK